MDIRTKNSIRYAVAGQIIYWSDILFSFVSDSDRAKSQLECKCIFYCGHLIRMYSYSVTLFNFYGAYSLIILSFSFFLYGVYHTRMFVIMVRWMTWLSLLKLMVSKKLSIPLVKLTRQSIVMLIVTVRRL